MAKNERNCDKIWRRLPFSQRLGDPSSSRGVSPLLTPPLEKWQKPAKLRQNSAPAALQPAPRRPIVISRRQPPFNPPLEKWRKRAKLRQNLAPAVLQPAPRRLIAFLMGPLLKRRPNLQNLQKVLMRDRRTDNDHTILTSLEQQNTKNKKESHCFSYIIYSPLSICYIIYMIYYFK